MGTALNWGDRSETEQDVQYECICSKQLTKINDISKLYDGRSVYCDKCKQNSKPNDILWHCDQNNIHKDGFDICNKCIPKYNVIQFREDRIPNNIETIRVLNLDNDESNISTEQVLKTKPNYKSYIISNNDEELLILIQFKQYVEIQQIKLYAFPSSIEHIKNNKNEEYSISAPKQVHIYKIDGIQGEFNQIISTNPIETINIPPSTPISEIISLQHSSELECVKCLAIYVQSNQDDTEQTYLNGIQIISTPSQRIITSNKQNQQQFKKINDEYTTSVPKLVPSKPIYLLEPGCNTRDQQCDLTKCQHLKGIIRILRRYRKFTKQQEQKQQNNDYDEKSNLCADDLDDIYYPNLVEFTNIDTDVKSEDTNTQSSSHNIQEEELFTMSKEEALKRFKIKDKEMHKDKVDVLKNVQQKTEKLAQQTMKQKVQIYALQAQQSSDPEQIKTQLTANIDNRKKQIQKIVLAKQYRAEKIKRLNSMQIKITDIDYDSVPSICDIIELHNDKYNHIDLLNDFHHLLAEHYQQFEEIYNIITHHKNVGECNLSNCLVFRRNYRNRSVLRDNERKLREMYFNNNIDDSYDIVYQQLLDKIHCYYYHTIDIGYKLTQKETHNILQNAYTQQENDEKKQSEVITVINALNKSKNKEDINIDDIIGNESSEKSKFVTSIDGDELMYSNGIRYFYWDYYKSQGLKASFIDRASLMYLINDLAANHGYRLEDWYIPPLFDNLMVEMLNNAICRLNKFQWRNLVKNAKAHIETDHFRKKMCRHKRSEIFYGVPFKSCITTTHLIAMLIYCNYDKLQARFSETYRRMQSDESDESLIKRHQNYAHLGRLLRECVECFGYDDEGFFEYRHWRLYHGISRRVHFGSTVVCFKGPVSTTTDFFVAANFATHVGMIVELNLDLYWSYLPDVDGNERGMGMMELFWISDYPNEQERFFIGGYSNFGITNIISVEYGINYSVYTYALCKLFHCFGDHSLSYSEQNMFKQYDKRTMNQLCFRMLLHEMHLRYPNETMYVEFESIPEYIEKLMSRNCDGIKQLRFFNIDDSKIERIIRSIFFDDYGWINLEKLMTVFPSVMHIEFKCEVNDQFMEIETVYLSILSYLEKHSDTKLEKIKIQIPRTNESVAKAATICQKFELRFNKQQYTILVDDSSIVFFILIQKDFDEWTKHLQTVAFKKHQENYGSSNNESDKHHRDYNQSHNTGSTQITPQISTSDIESTESFSDKESITNSPSTDIYYGQSDKNSNSATLPLPQLVSSSDEIMDTNSESNTTQNETPASYTNVIQTLLTLMVKIIHIIHLWEVFSTSELQEFQHRLRVTNDPNDIITFGPGKQNGKTSKKLSGDNYNENKRDRNGNKRNNDSNNNGNSNHNHRRNNDQSDKNEQNDNCIDDDYDCNIPWHAKKIKDLEQKVYKQNEEIKRLKIKLQREIECNSFIKNEILSIPTDIKQNQCQIEFKKTELTVIDGLYQNMKCKDNISSTRIRKIKQILEEEQYDSDALAIDILANDKDESNIAKLIKSYSEYTSIQQYIQQNSKENKSSIELNINPSMKLTEKTIGNHVEEKFVNVNDYLKKYILLNGHHAMRECNNGENVVIDYNIHRKHESKETETESLYVICDRRAKKHKYLPSLSTGIYGKFVLIPNDFEWKMRDKLFTRKQTEKLCNLSIKQMPRAVTKQSMLMEQIYQTMQQIKCELKNDKKRKKFIKSKSIKWNQPEKVPIFNKKSSKSRLSLKLSKEEFVKRLCKFNDKLTRDDNSNNMVYDINLIPTIKDKHFEIIWIVSIGKDINIGISVKLHQNKKYKWIMPMAIYLDINDQHKLVPYKNHKCQCLSNFICCIDELKIGNKANTIHQKYETLQKKVNIVKEHVKSAGNLRKTHFVDIPFNLENDENNNKYHDKMDIGQGLGAFHSYPVTPKLSVSVSSSTTLNNNEEINEGSVSSELSLHCQCLAFQKLSIAGKYIQSLEDQHKMDVNTINEIKNEATKWNSLLQKQNALQIQQNQHQQIIDSLLIHKTTASSSNQYHLRQQEKQHDTH